MIEASKTNFKGRERDSIHISKDELIKLVSIPFINYDLKRRINIIISDTEEDYVDIYEILFIDLVAEIIAYTDTYSKFDEYDNSISTKVDEYNREFAKYLELRGTLPRHNYFEVVKEHTDYARDLVVKLRAGNITGLDQILTNCININDLRLYIEKIRDIKNALESIKESLKYVCDENTYNKYIKKIEELESKEDIPDLLSIIEETQNMIKEHWKGFVNSSHDIKPGQPFRFIGHSTSITHLKDGEFISKFISCSLFTEDLTDTYRLGYGFMFDADSIISASYKDTYTNNYADDVENALNSTSIPCIYTPEEIIGKCLEQKSTNPPGTKVYNEVVLDGFKPIGIFCFTDGSKGLNDNYEAAMKLHQQFPDLPFIEIDLTLYGYDNRNVLQLISKLEYKTSKKMGVYNEDTSMKYFKFFQEFMQLKEHGNYTEDDIMILYQYHNSRLDKQLDVNELLKENISIEDKRYFLRHNSFIHIDDILTKEVISWYLNCLCELDYVNDKEQLDILFPGIVKTIELLKQYPINGQLITRISIMQNRDFNKINELILMLVQKEKESLEDELKGLEEEYALVESEIAIKKERISKLDAAQSLTYGEFSYESEVSHISYNEESISSYEGERKKLLVKEQQLQASRLEKEVEKERLQRKLLPHKAEIMRLEDEIRKIEFEISLNRSDIDFYTKQVESARESIESTKSSFESTYCCPFDEFYERLVQAKKLLETYDSFAESMDLFDLERHLEDLKTKIDRLKQEIELKGGIYDIGIGTKH